MVNINAGARTDTPLGLRHLREYPDWRWTWRRFYVSKNADWALTTVPEIAKQLNLKIVCVSENLCAFAETGLIGSFYSWHFSFIYSVIC